jgi:hypothetical protein
MAEPLSISGYMPLTSDGKHFNVFRARFRNIRYAVPAEQSIVIDAAMAANAPGIAHKYLGDVKLWWVILHYNGLADGIADLQPGRRIFIPNRRTLLAFLERQESTTKSVRL